MDSKIVKKMNEIIGFMKLIEREMLGRASAEDRIKLLLDRKKDLDLRLEELDEMMAVTLTDAQTIKFHSQVKEEVNKLMAPVLKRV